METEAQWLARVEIDRLARLAIHQALGQSTKK
jgi:hypothetical protein